MTRRHKIRTLILRSEPSSKPIYFLIPILERLCPIIGGREDGEQEGIPDVVHVIIGLAQDIHRVCVAAWEDVPGSQLTKEV